MLMQALIRSSSRLRLLPLRNAAAVVYTRKYAANPTRCDPHMNELPIPCGPWDVWYNEQQGFYNKVLAFGALWWIISLALMIYSGSFYLNWGPPAQPSAPSEMGADECEEEEDL